MGSRILIDGRATAVRSIFFPEFYFKFHLKSFFFFYLYWYGMQCIYVSKYAYWVSYHIVYIISFRPFGIAIGAIKASFN